MGQTADEVRREIERTRSEMGSTIDAIGDRVSPRRAYERKTERVRGGLRSVREAVMGTADAGMGTVTGAAGSLTAGVGTVGEGVSTGVGTVVAGGQALASTAVDAVGSAPDTARRQAAGNPLAAGLVAFGGGLLLASVLPKTRIEQQAAAAVAPTVVEPAKEQAKRVGQELGEHLAGTAGEAADTVKQQAASAAEQVKEQASSAGQQVVDDATTAAQDVSRTAAGAAERVSGQAAEATDQVRSAAPGGGGATGP